MNACTSVYYTTRRISSRDTAIHSRSLRRKRPGPRPVNHAQACLRLRMSYHPCAHSLTIAHSSVMSILRRILYVYRSLPLPQPSVAQPIRAITQYARAGNTRRWRHRRLHRRFGSISRVRAHVCHYYSSSARFHSAHIFTFEILPRQFYLHDRLRFPSLYFSRVLRILQPRPELQRIIDGCSVAGTKSVQYRTTGIVLPFPDNWVPPNLSPSLARFKLSWKSFVALLEQAWKTLNVLSALLLSCSHLFLALEARTLTFVRQCYPDRIPDPGSGEQSVDTHYDMCSLVSFGMV